MYAVIANVVSDGILRTGARVWILYHHGDAEIARVRGCSKGGRVVNKYIPYKRLKNFRAAFVPEHLRDRFEHHYLFETKEEADGVAASQEKFWNRVRAYSPDGAEIKPGISYRESLLKKDD